MFCNVVVAKSSSFRRHKAVVRCVFCQARSQDRCCWLSSMTSTSVSSRLGYTLESMVGWSVRHYSVSSRLGYRWRAWSAGLFATIPFPQGSATRWRAWSAGLFATIPFQGSSHPRSSPLSCSNTIHCRLNVSVEWGPLCILVCWS